MADPYDGMELQEASSPAGADPYAGQAPVDANDPYAGMDLQSETTPTPDGVSHTQQALQSTQDGSAYANEPVPEITVVGHRQSAAPAQTPGPPGATSWHDILAGIPQSVGAKLESRYAGAKEFVGNNEYQDAQKKLWQSLILPQAVQEAKDAGIALTELPYVQDTAKRLGIRVDRFTEDWPDYVDMKPDEQEAFYQKQVARIQEGQEQASKAGTLRQSAQETSRTFGPAASMSGWDPKNIIHSTLVGIPDLLAGMAVGAGATAVGGPVAGATAATTYFVGTAAPEEYAEARNQGADHDTATTYAALSGLANAIPEIPVLKAVTDGGVGRKILTKAISEKFAGSLPGRMVNTSASQALAQTVISGVQTAIDNGVMDKNITLSEALNKMAQSALVGGTTGAPLGVMHGGHPAGNNQETNRPEPTQTVSQAPESEGSATPETGNEPPSEPGTTDAPKTMAALQAVLDKSIDPGQMEHLESAGLAARNDVGVPRLLPAGRRALTALQGGKSNEEATAAAHGEVSTPVKTPVETGEETPAEPSFQDRLARARLDTDRTPTKEQQESGDYDKGELPFGGMTMVIENARGTTRQGKDWNQKMANDYGYLKDIKGADGDELDAFLTGKPDTGRVFVITQHDPATGKFDEHKVILGATSEQQARAVYRANYPKDWKGYESTEAMSTEDFKERAEAGYFAKGPEPKEPVPVMQRADSAHGHALGDLVRLPPEEGGELGKIRSIFRYNDNHPWVARVSTESGMSTGIDLPHEGLENLGQDAKASATEPDPTRDSALQFLAKKGGVNLKAAEEEGFDRADLADHRVGIKRAFHSKGVSLETAGERLRDAGYDVTSEGPDGEHTLDYQKTLDIIDKELRGSPQYSNKLDPRIHARREALEESHRAQIEADAQKDIPDWKQQPEAEQSITALADHANQHDPEGVERALEHEDDDEVRKQLREIIHRGQEDEGKARQGAGQPAEARRGERVEEEGHPLLELHTEAELAERDRQKKEIERVEAEALKRAKERAAADTEAKDFRLTGSDRPADVAAAGGQKDLFGVRESTDVSEKQTEFFPASGTEAESGAAKHRGPGRAVPKSAADASQLQMFTPDTAARPRDARTTTSTKLAEVGKFSSGIKRVTKWQDAAHILAPLRKSPQESFMALALDEHGKPLAVLRHSIGDQSGAGAVPHVIMGALARIPRIASVYFGHNHPSGRTDQSDPDKMITAKMHDLMSGSGITPMGMIVVSPGSTKASFYHPHMGEWSDSIESPITTARRTKSRSVPVVERRFSKVATAAKNRYGNLDRAGAIEQVEHAAKTSPQGLLAYNTRHHLIGHLPMTSDQMSKLRTGSVDSGIAHLTGQLENMNATDVVSYGNATDNHALLNLGAALSQIGIRHLDTFVQDGAGWHSQVGADQSLSHGDTFYSRNDRDSAGTGLARGELERTVRKTIRDSSMRASPDFPHVEVHQDYTTLPPHLRAHVEADGAEHTAGAMYDPDTGRIHMIADNLGSEREATETLWHEAVGHHGLRLIMDKERYDNVMDGIWNAMESRVRDTAQRNGLDVDDLAQRRMAAEEVIAYAAGKHLSGEAMDKPMQSLWTRAVNAIKAFFVRVSGKPFTSNDDIAQLIGESKRALETGATQQRMSDIAKSTRATTFYSAVERAVEVSKQAKASAEQWLATLRKTPGVKAEEMSWLGVEDWLKAQPGQVTKSELQDFIKANQLHLEETVHGDDGARQTEAERRQTEQVEALRAQGYHVTFNDLGELDLFRPPDSSDQSFVVRQIDDPDAFDGVPAVHQKWLAELQETSRQVAMERTTGDTGYEVPQGWDRAETDVTRYGDYTLPGGTNYREMLIRKPMDASDTLNTVYKSGHFNEKNILAHVRFKDRTDADGKKVLFLEELQSDWHQAGRRHGYKVRPDERDLANQELDATRAKALEILRREDNLGFDTTQEALRAIRTHDDWKDRWSIPVEDHALMDRYVSALRRVQASGSNSTVPDAPFKTSWPSLIMKRMIRHAAEGGYDRIAWTTGEQQAERYNLAKVFSGIKATKNDDGTFDIRGIEADWEGTYHDFNNLSAQQLEDTVGKDLAKKIAEQQPGVDDGKRYSGLDLKIGGEGMKGFYDGILPRETQKLIEKMGGKVDDGRVLGVGMPQFERVKESGNQPMLDAAQFRSHGFDITQQMREQALSHGFPMYWKKPSQKQLDLQREKGPGWYERVRSAVNHLVNNPLTNDFRKQLAPTTMDEESRRTARLATAALGKLAHNTHETKQALEAFSRQVDKMSPEQQLEMMDAIENGLPQPNAELQPIANEMRKQLDVNRDKVRALGMGYLDNFIQNYFPHYWADPDEAKRVMASIMGRRPLRGPASFLKMRTIPTIKEGLDAGLTPLSINPLVLTLLKVREMQRFVAGVKMMQDLKDAHLAQFLPAGKVMPDGWVAINDNSAKVRQWSEEEHGFIERGQYIMPEGAGRLINNHVGRSAIADFAPLHAMRVGSNVLNSMQLGFSAFHLGFTTLDAMVSKNSLGIERLTHGEPGRAAQAFLEGMTPVGAAMNLARGMALLRAYSDPAGATPELAKVVKALEAGGGRVSMDRYYLAVQGANPFHGAGFVSLAGDIKAALKGPAPARDVAGAVGRFPIEYGRKMYRGLQELVALHHPLQIPFELAGRAARAGSSIIMEHIVPMQKLGVFADLARDYIRRNPTATDEQLADAMQSAWRSVDNRLGEMVYDNKFWNRTQKDVMHLGVRAVGWNWGTVSEIGGAPIDTIKLIDKAIKTGKISADDVGHKIPYVLGLTLTTAMLGAITNYMFTGQGPQELKDYFFPRTGGVTSHGTPERLSLPSYMKDIYEYSQRPGQTVANKLNPLFGIVASIWNNQDYFGDPIADPEDPDYKQLLAKGEYAAKEAMPFSIQGTKQIAGSDKNDAMGKVKRVLPFVGVTPAPGYITSPDQIERQERFFQEQKYSQELRYKMKKAAASGDQKAMQDYKDQFIQSRERLRQLQEGVKMDKAQSAAARHRNATSMRQKGYPATAGLIDSLPLEQDQEARSYFAKVAESV